MWVGFKFTSWIDKKMEKQKGRTDEWSKKGFKICAIGVFINGKIIVCGGRYPWTSSCYVYENGQGWTKLADMSKQRAGSASISIPQWAVTSKCSLNGCFNIQFCLFILACVHISFQRLAQCSSIQSQSVSYRIYQLCMYR